MRPPEKIILLSTTICCLLIILFLYFPTKQDEGVFLTMARFWDGNHFIYRDFFDHKPPGIFLFLWPFARISNNLIFFRILIQLVNLTTAFLIHKIIISKYDLKVALFGGVTFLWLANIFQGYLIETEPMMTLCLVFATYLFLIGEHKTSRFFLCGFSVGLALLFKQPAIINLLIFLLLVWHEKSLRKLVFFLSGFMVALLPVIYIGYRIGFNIFLRQVVTYNLRYPPYDSKEIILPLILSLPILYLCLVRLFKKVRQRFWTNSDVLIILSIIMVLPVIFIRTYPHYWLQILPFVVMLLSAEIFALRKMVAVLTVVSLLAFCIMVVKNEGPKSFEQRKITTIIKNSTKNNEKIYTTRMFSGAYFLSQRKPISKYLYINEVSRQDDSCSKTLRVIKHEKPQIIIWVEKDKYYLEPYAWDLSKYIWNNYRIIERFPKSNLVIYKLTNNNGSIIEPTPIGIK